MMKLREIFGLRNKSGILESSIENETASPKDFPEYDSFRERHLASAKNKEELATSLLSGLAKEVEIVQGVFLQYARRSSRLSFLAGYACGTEDKNAFTFELGDGFPGQVAADRKAIYLEDLPDNYLSIKTGLGEAKPRTLLILPVQKNNTLIGVVELASFKAIDENSKLFIEEILSHFGTEPASFKSSGKK